jgi:hypothetical protein
MFSASWFITAAAEKSVCYPPLLPALPCLKITVTNMNNTNKPSILFDIDLTLFDANLFRLNVYPILAGAIKISLPEFNETLASYTNALEKSSDFLPNRFLRHIAKAHSFPFKELFNTYFHPRHFTDALYPDTVPALQKLFPGRNLGIYSEGYLEFQTTKLRLSGILDI